MSNEELIPKGKMLQLVEGDGGTPKLPMYNLVDVLPKVPVPRLVEQREVNDCFIASLAMALNYPYEFVTHQLGDELMERVRQRGLYGDDLNLAFERLKLHDGVEIKHIPGLTESNAWRLKSWLWKRPAILQFDSINFRAQQHAVYWDGEDIFDPSRLKKITNEHLKFGCNHVWLISPDLGK